MSNLTLRCAWAALAAGLLLSAPGVQAQQTQTPATDAKATPRPDELEPGVNTSATPPPPSSASTPVSSPSGAVSSAAPKSAPATANAKGTQTDKKGTDNKKGATGTNAAKAGKAEDHLQLDTTQITGNQELPKVLYIVPWKRSDLGDLLGKPANSLLDEVLEPVDRDVFKRENRYYDAVKPDAAGAAAGAGQNSGEKR